jgi:hypothetical protein
MGRTLPSVTQVFLHEQESFLRFRRALRRSDQKALDDLFAAAHKHLAAAAYASHALPFEIFLLSMLLEEHKQVLRTCSTPTMLEPRAGKGDSKPTSIRCGRSGQKRSPPARWETGSPAWVQGRTHNLTWSHLQSRRVPSDCLPTLTQGVMINFHG